MALAVQALCYCFIIILLISMQILGLWIFETTEIGEI